MRHLLLSIITVITITLHTAVPVYGQSGRTLKSEMEVIHETLGMNFVYDSSIDIYRITERR